MSGILRKKFSTLRLKLETKSDVWFEVTVKNLFL